MQTAKRFYVYFVSGVGLAVLLVGLGNLIGLALEQLWEAIGWTTIVSRDADSLRQQLSLYTALVVVALPIWLFHWRIAERSVMRAGPDGMAERQSVLRSLYFALILIVTLQFWLTGLAELLTRGIHSIVNTQGIFGTNTPMAIALVAVTSAAWAYHVSVRLRDIRAGKMEETAVWLPRLYHYAALFFSAIMMLIGSTILLGLIGDAIFGADALVREDPWWAPDLANGIATLLAGALVWILHWWYSLTVLERGDWYSLSERQSLLRRAYMYLVILVGVVMTVMGLASSLETVFRLVLDARETTGTKGVIQHLIEPIVGALPFAAFWFYHRQRLTGEVRRFAPLEVQASVRRFYIYGLALVGFVFAAAGSAYTAGILVDLLFGGTRTGDPAVTWWRGQISQFGALALVGAGIWLWHWYCMQAERDMNPAVELSTTSRRVYLYTIIAGTLVAILGSLSVIIYRLFNVLLDVTPSGGLAFSTSAALGVLIIAVPAMTYHGLILRQDMLAKDETKVEPVETQTEQEKIPELRAFVLSGPPGSDLTGELESLREHLHPGFTIREAKLRV